MSSLLESIRAYDVHWQSRDTAARAATELVANTEPESAHSRASGAGSTDAQPAVSRFDREVRPGSTTSSEGHFSKVLNDVFPLGQESVLAGSGSGGLGVLGGLPGAALALPHVFFQPTCVGGTKISELKNSSSTWGTSLCQQNLERSTVEPGKNLSGEAAPKDPGLGFDTMQAAPSGSSTGENSNKEQTGGQEEILQSNMAARLALLQDLERRREIGEITGSQVQDAMREDFFRNYSPSAQSALERPHTVEESGSAGSQLQELGKGVVKLLVNQHAEHLWMVYPKDQWRGIGEGPSVETGVGEWLMVPGAQALATQLAGALQSITSAVFIVESLTDLLRRTNPDNRQEMAARWQKAIEDAVDPTTECAQGQRIIFLGKDLAEGTL
jgi:hypothetical protein